MRLAARGLVVEKSIRMMIVVGPRLAVVKTRRGLGRSGRSRSQPSMRFSLSWGFVATDVVHGEPKLHDYEMN